TIKVTDQKSGTTGVANATVVPIILKLSPSTATVGVGATTTLTVTASDANGPIATPPNLRWTSSNESVATAANGVVTGVAAGSATITVTDPVTGASADASVTVTGCSGSNSSFQALTVSTDSGGNHQVFATFCFPGGFESGVTTVNILYTQQLTYVNNG